MIDVNFSIEFVKGKTYREKRFGVIPSLPQKDFNPSNIFGIYLDRVALLHSESNCASDFLFPNIRLVKGKVFTRNSPVSYDDILKMVKREAFLAHIFF